MPEHIDPQDHDRLPRGDQPLHGERRSLLKPALALVALLVLLAVVFGGITVLRYST
jgi:hypothetical protein